MITENIRNIVIDKLHFIIEWRDGTEISFELDRVMDEMLKYFRRHTIVPQEIGKMIFVPYSSLRSTLYGRWQLRVDEYLRLCQYLEVSPEFFLEYKKIREKLYPSGK